MNNFFVNVFSNSCMDKFPDNSLTSFTISLPKPIILNENESWSCALYDLNHSPIIGTVKGDGAQDSITLLNLTQAEIISNLSIGLDINGLVKLILSKSTRPHLYKRVYFHEFLDYSNIENFESNEILKKYSFEVPEYEEHHSINHQFPKFSFRNKSNEVEMYVKHVIKLDKTRSYTMCEILWQCLHTHAKIIKDIKSDESLELMKQYGFTENERNTPTSLLLMHYVKTFVDTVFNCLKDMKGDALESAYMLLYTDFVEPSIISDKQARVLYSCARSANSTKDSIQISKLRYHQVDKHKIQTLSFLFCDETGSQLMMQTSATPTFLVLHFRKN